MKRKRRERRCDCGLAMGADGTCPAGCHKFRKPERRYKTAAAQSRRKQEKARVSEERW